MGLLGAVRMMSHHGAEFDPRQYEKEIAIVKRIIEKGKPFEPRLSNLVRKYLRQSQLQPTNNTSHSMGSFMHLVTTLIELNYDQVTAVLTLLLPDIGPAFPETVNWMNRYVTGCSFMYELKEHATWEDVQSHLDQKQPVLCLKC